MNYKKIKTSMDSILRFMEDSKSQFVKDPISDFTRARKLSFSETIKCLRILRMRLSFRAL